MYKVKLNPVCLESSMEHITMKPVIFWSVFHLPSPAHVSFASGGTAAPLLEDVVEVPLTLLLFLPLSPPFFKSFNT